jgi:soluble lytic murein transglycosylase-like protein
MRVRWQVAALLVGWAAIAATALGQPRGMPPEPPAPSDSVFGQREEPRSEATTVTFMAESRILSLTPDDAARYRAAFAAVEARDWPALEGALAGIGDPVLVGHLQGMRLLATEAPFADLAQWLDRHRDTALATSLRERALRVRAEGDPEPTRLDRGRGRRLPGAAEPVNASADERARLRAIAVAYFSGDLDTTRALAAAGLGGALDAEIAWYGALAAFRQGDPATAATLFARTDSASVDGWKRAAANWWSARAALASGDARGVLARLEAATRWPDTFYGQLALAQLGRDTPLRFDLPAQDAVTVRAWLARWPNARRAAALAQLNRLAEAEAELRVLHARLAPADDPAFLAFAEALAAPGAQIRAAEFGGTAAAAGHCPYTAFMPGDGFRIDPAIIYAVTRQESRFSPTAISTANAQGLMQILPSTAAWMDNDASLRADPRRLHEPRLNMRIGQDYLEYLLERPYLGANLMAVYAAYNGGPGFMQRWLADFPGRDDPLVMLESIPRAESRAYAERVLAFTFLCRKRAGLPNPELDAMAAGRQPIHRTPDAASIAVLAPQIAPAGSAPAAAATVRRP